MLFRRKEKDLLNSKAGDQMLKTIFDVCEVEPNTIPLDELISYSNYRKDRYHLQKVIILLIMVLFFLIPILFIGPRITALEQTATAPQPVYTLGVDSLIPVTSVKADVEGEHVPVYETEKSVYSIEPTRSGNMKVVVTCANGQYTETEILVSTIDSDVPVVLDDYVRGDYVYVHMEDKGSGIDYDKIYAMGNDKEKIYPDIVNEKEGYIAFKYPSYPINIFTPDKSENTLQLVLTVK